MKNIAGSILLVFILVGSATAGSKTDRERDGLFGPVKTITLKIEMTKILEEKNPGVEFQSYDIKGNKKESIRYKEDGSIELKFINTYNEKGEITSNGLYDGESLMEETKFSYDGKGRKIQVENFFYYDESLNSKTKFTYDDKGNPIEGVTHNKNGVVISKFVNIFDNKGNEIEILIYKGNGDLESRWIKIYNDASKLVEEFNYNGKGLILSEKSFIYNEKGSLIEEIYSHNDGIKSLSKYDRKGNIIKEIYSTKEFPRKGTSIYTYTYDKWGNWIKKVDPFSTTYRKITYYEQ